MNKVIDTEQEESMEEKTIRLEELEGVHILTGVDMENRQVDRYGDNYFEDCTCLNFVLDGVVYTAIENPEDGYHSALDKVIVSSDVVDNTFEPVAVFAKHFTRLDNHYECDILRLFDLKNSKMILEVGTGNIDDYYPYFVGSFFLEDMSVNQGGDDAL